LIWEDGSVCKKIGAGAFRGANLNSLELPDSIEIIGKGAFDSNPSLTAVYLPKSLKTLHDSAFQNCTKLAHVWIPNEITLIDGNVFANTNLDVIEVEGDNANPRYKVLNGCLIDLQSKTLIKGTNNSTIPEGVVTTISQNAFAEQSRITSIIVPEGIREIPSYFARNCSELDYIELPDTVTMIDSQAFYQCTSLCKSSDGILVLPDSIESISSFSFGSCTELVDLTLPKNLKNLRAGGGNFNGCTKLQTVRFRSVDLQQSMLESFASGNANGSRAFENCTSLREVFWPNAESEDAKKCLTHLGIPSTVTIHYNYEVK
jgi:hypothetical protein